VTPKEIERRVDVKFKCECLSVVVRKNIRSNNSVAFTKQCLDCGKNWGGVKKIRVSEKDKKNAVEFDEELQIKYWNDRRDEFKKLKAEEREHSKKHWFEWYEKYLNSEEWKKKRSLVLQRDSDQCQGCLLDVATEVHHLSYKNVGHELLFELVSLCSDCHHSFHNARKEQLNFLANKVL